MTTTLDTAKTLQTDLDPKWEEHIDLIRRTVAQGSTPDELRLFLYTARRAGLDPLAKQIYYIRRKGRGTIQVAIDGLRLIADRTGRYAGGDAAEFLGNTEEGYPQIARVTIYKMVGGVRCPFSASARWEEYYPGDEQGFTWRKMPHTMLAKCAEALALRRAFPADLSGLYVHEEMAQAGDVGAVIPTMVDPSPQPQPDPTPAPQPDVTPEPEPQTPIPGVPNMPDVPGVPGNPDVPSPYEPGPSPEPMPAPQPSAPIGDPPAPGIRGEAGRGKADAPQLEVVENGALPRAFGYAPPRWPSAKMMGEAATENQFRMLRRKADERHLNERELGKIREAVLTQYGVDEDASKGALSLVIDFLVASSPAALDAARGVRRAA